MNSIKAEFLSNNLQKEIQLIFHNGFQLRGILQKFDEEYMLIETNRYGGFDTKSVLVSLANVSTYVPGNDT